MSRSVPQIHGDASGFNPYIENMKLNPFSKRAPSVSIVRLEGIIAASGRARPSQINDSSTADLVDKAFAKGKPRAVAIVINSPGGSPVQSSLIGARIRRHADATGIPVYAFVEDVAASGGYWIASAADKIFVDACSIVGSIGVISSSFGFHEFLARYGMERRIHVAGEEKSLLDPFLPEDPREVGRLREVLEELHAEFIAHVRRRRGDHLVDSDIFTGKFWLGTRAVDLGLADGVGHVVPKMHELFGENVKFRKFARKRRMIPDFGAEISSALLTDMEERVSRSRFGL